MMIREKQDLKAWNQERKVETGREKKGTGVLEKMGIVTTHIGRSKSKGKRIRESRKKLYT